MTLNDIVSNLTRTGRSGDYRIEISTYCKNNIIDDCKIKRKPQCYIYVSQTGLGFEIDIISAKVDHDALTVYQVNELLNKSCSINVVKVDDKETDMLSLYKSFAHVREKKFKEEQERKNKEKQRIIENLLYVQNSYSKISTKNTKSIADMIDTLIQEEPLNGFTFLDLNASIVNDLYTVEGKAALLELGLTK